MNSSQFLLKPIPMERIMAIAKCHYMDSIPVVDKSANNSVNLNLPVGTGITEFLQESIGSWDFLVTHIVGTFTTVTDDGAGAIIDDGVTRTLFNIALTGWSRNLSRSFFPVDHFFTPGRTRHPSSTNNTGANQCAPSNGLLVPKPCPVLLLKGQGFSAQFKQSALKANQVNMTLHGWRVTIPEKALQKILQSIENDYAQVA